MAKSKKVLTVKKLNADIQRRNLGWTAAANPISRLSEERQILRLGLKLDKKDLARIKKAFAVKGPAVGFASARDWRNKDGKNWVTDIRDQGNCGSCVAFGTNATIECQARIQFDKPNWNINLSEADLFFCGAGKKCSQGWWPTHALNYARDKGISDEACFPYQDHDIDCNLCDDKQDRMVKIGAWQEITDVDQRKAWLDKNGPMVACMAVYQDFFYYKKGVYRRDPEAELKGYHAICCIGYSEEEKCWICKNSWSTSWGDNGFFKIAYGQAEIDTTFAMYGVEKITRPSEDEDDDKDEGCAWTKHVVVDYSFDNNRRIIWAHLDGKWRYHLATEAQLAGLGNILFNANGVWACYKGSEITQIQGWKNLP
jgi:C1A family cysteine protease